MAKNIVKNTILTDFLGILNDEKQNRKGKISSKREWVFNIYNQAKEKNIPVFMKEDLLGILKEDEFVQEFPKEFGGIE